MAAGSIVERLNILEAIGPGRVAGFADPLPDPLLLQTAEEGLGVAPCQAGESCARPVVDGLRHIEHRERLGGGNHRLRRRGSPRFAVLARRCEGALRERRIGCASVPAHPTRLQFGDNFASEIAD